MQIPDFQFVKRVMYLSTLSHRKHFVSWSSATLPRDWVPFTPQPPDAIITLNSLAYFTICHSCARFFVLSVVICSISCIHEFNPPWHLSAAWDRDDFWSNCSLLSPLHFKHSLLLVGVAKQKCTKEMREYIKSFTIAALLWAPPPVAYR